MAKTDWKMDDDVLPEDMNNIGQEINENAAEIAAIKSTNLGYGTTAGTGAAYTVTLNPAPTVLAEGLRVTVKIHTNNTGAATLNVNGLGAKALKKPNGNDYAAGQLKNGSVYSFVYNGSNFIAQGEGGEYGTATADDVRVGKTVGTENGIVSGTFTADATATAAHILANDTAYVNGQKVTGTMPNRTFAANGGNYTNTAGWKADGGGSLTVIPVDGYYKQETNAGGFGPIIFYDADFIAANIRSGVDIFGLVGTLVPGGLLASGSYTYSPPTTMAFQDWQGNTYYTQYAQVTGLSLPMAPNAIIARCEYWSGSDGYSFLTIYFKAGATINGQLYQVVTGAQHYMDGSSGIGGWRIGGNSYVDTTGFRIPFATGINYSNMTLNWYIY